jgi:hypothetical protein
MMMAARIPAALFWEKPRLFNNQWIKPTSNNPNTFVSVIPRSGILRNRLKVSGKTSHPKKTIKKYQEIKYVRPEFIEVL